MLSELQTSLLPYIGIVGENPWLQALLVIAISQLLAWIFDHFICAALRNMTRRTHFSFGDELIGHFHKPIYASVMLLGLALAANLLEIGEPYDFFVFSGLKTVAFIVWSIFLLRVVRSVLRGLAAHEDRIQILHPQTLPLFENIAMIIIVVYDGLVGIRGHRRHRGRFCRQGYARQPVFRGLHHGRRTLQNRRLRRTGYRRARRNYPYRHSQHAHANPR
jgi:hypothetical protein